MSTVAIVGGHGQVARRLVDVLVAAGDTAVALVRNEDHRGELEAQGAEVRLLDIEVAEAAEFGTVFGGCDAVVFAAGGGGDGSVARKQTVDLGGSLKSIEGARLAGIRRFVQVSAMGVDSPVGDDAAESWRAYVDAKRDADAALRDSDLDWTIIRPGRLTDDEATGRVTLGEALDSGEVARADVAQVLAACLDDVATIGKQWDLVRGGTAVAEAIAAACSAA